NHWRGGRCQARGGIMTAIAIAKPLAHDSAAKHVSGAALYVDDIPEPPGTLQVYIAMSAHAHARVTGLDLDPVRAYPGVACVLSAADIPGVNDASPLAGDDPVFADGLVAYAGQSLFAVAAADIATARRAAALAAVDYHVLDPVLTVDEAMDRGSFVLPGHEMRQGDAEQGLAAAKNRLRGRLRVGGQDHFYLEGQVALAVPGED